MTRNEQIRSVYLRLMDVLDYDITDPQLFHELLDEFVELVDDG